MTLVFVVVGMLLAALGFWGGPPVAQSKRGEGVRSKVAASEQEPWKVLAQPIRTEDELIKIPEHRPWYMPGRDRRFHRGALMGLGCGFLVAGLAMLFTPTPASSGQPVAGRGPVTDVPQVSGSEPATTPPVVTAPADAEPDKPPVKSIDVTIVINSGEYSGTVAAKLMGAELIPSEEEFLQRLAERKLETVLQIGTFKIPTGSTVDQVIDILTP